MQHPLLVRMLLGGAGLAGCIALLSGAAHDTMCVAAHVPSGMVFVPCKDGISHHPDEDADPADAALAAEIILNAVQALARA